ncbi:hypothetical protein LWI28_025966 [Acer negundo]|uniref:Uncharacterized protein n=1 Tax=Acer negundo TaxID=4023 RepID=A0AAD5I8F5_ACENE|nr:hypothetical protein LWI28_025966 [Acer negundo]
MGAVRATQNHLQPQFVRSGVDRSPSPRSACCRSLAAAPLCIDASRRRVGGLGGVSTNQGFLGSITSDYEIQVLASYQLLTSSFVSYEIFELDSSCYESNCISEVPVCKEVRICDLLSLANGGGSRGNNLKKKSLKWFEQSTLKPKLEPLEVLVTQLEGFENDEMSLIQVEAITEGSALTSPKRNLEMKMSKKIVLNKKQMTSRLV